MANGGSTEEAEAMFRPGNRARRAAEGRSRAHEQDGHDGEDDNRRLWWWGGVGWAEWVRVTWFGGSDRVGLS